MSCELNISKKDNYYINVAYNESLKSIMCFKHGCCVVQNNKVIGLGHNIIRTQFSDGFIGSSCSCHAEMCALRNAVKTKKNKVIKKKKFTCNLTVYIVRTSKKLENLENSAPCVDCYKKMKEIGVSKIVYSSDNGEIKKERMKNYKPKTISRGRRNILRSKHHVSNKEELYELLKLYNIDIDIDIDSIEESKISI
jgi:deoxycytidylate deaminase